MACFCTTPAGLHIGYSWSWNTLGILSCTFQWSAVNEVCDFSQHLFQQALDFARLERTESKFVVHQRWNWFAKVFVWLKELPRAINLLTLQKWKKMSPAFFVFWLPQYVLDKCLPCAFILHHDTSASSTTYCVGVLSRVHFSFLVFVAFAFSATARFRFYMNSTTKLRWISSMTNGVAGAWMSSCGSRIGRCVQRTCEPLIVYSTKDRRAICFAWYTVLWMLDRQWWLKRCARNYWFGCKHKKSSRTRIHARWRNHRYWILLLHANCVECVKKSGESSKRTRTHKTKQRATSRNKSTVNCVSYSTCLSCILASHVFKFWPQWIS